MASTKLNTNQLNSIHQINAPQGFLINGKIVPSVASNNLTVAIKGLDGNDPSASNPVYCRIGDTIRSITTALSVTKNAGTSWCYAGSAELATKEIDYFVYLGYNATDGVVIGFSRIPYATLYSDFSATATNEKYCGISTITNAAAGDAYENIGRFAATLSAGAGYTWTVPTFTAANLIQRPIYETRYLAWVPVGPTNATLTGRYKINSNQFFGQISVAVTGACNFAETTMAFTVGASALANNTFYGGYVDSGTAARYGKVIARIRAGYNTIIWYNGESTTGDLPGMSASVPITWANGDSAYISFYYEI